MEYNRSVIFLETKAKQGSLVGLQDISFSNLKAGGFDSKGFQSSESRNMIYNVRLSGLSIIFANVWRKAAKSAP